MLPKKSPKKPRVPGIVPTEMPLFGELQRRGLVVVMGQSPKPELSPRREKKRSR